MPKDSPESPAVEAQDKPTPAVEAQEDPELPKVLRMSSLYGYYNDSGEYRQWPEGQEITDPEDIAVLIDRGAPVEGA